MSAFEPPSTHPDNIQPAQTSASGEQLKDKLQHSLEAGKESVSSCCSSIGKESSQLCDAATDSIRRNPIASVVGAAFVGAAVCYLILENRHQPTFRDRYVTDPLSQASNSLGSIFNSLKFW